MGSLATSKIKDKFGNLLHVEGGIDGTTKDVEDGTGDASALKLSNSTVEIDGTLNFTAAPTTDSSEQTALLINGSDNVVKRELGTAAFTDQLPRIIARVASDTGLDDSSEKLTYADIDNTNTAASFFQGDTSQLPLNANKTDVRIITTGVYKVTVSLHVASIAQDPTITVNVKRGTTVIANDIQSPSGTDRMICFSVTQRLAASDDNLEVNVTAASGNCTIKAGSMFEVERIA